MNLFEFSGHVCVLINEITPQIETYSYTHNEVLRFLGVGFFLSRRVERSGEFFYDLLPPFVIVRNIFIDAVSCVDLYRGGSSWNVLECVNKW